jgi:(E)-4-hydroxy-3-methylbut-2-enyl-diphosphate synthase
MNVALGMPALPAPVLAERRKTRKLRLNHPTHPVEVGGDAPISVQSMTTTLTSDVNATLQQIAELTAAGCQIVRVAVPSQDDADALTQIARKSGIPVIADIHFQPKYVFAAIDAGCAAVRVNPGNIKQFDDKVGEIARAAKDAGVPIRIGVNAGSLDRRLLEKYGKATPEALVESALWECSLFEEHDFRDIKISVKHNDPVVMVSAYRLLAAKCDYPLHLGVTEAGPAFQGTIKSAVAFGALLSQGIGDTIRVSLSAPPVEEVKVGNQILESLNLRKRGLEIVSCPSCGRAQVDVYTLAEQVTAGLEGLAVPLRVAVMGCVVNGPGEAREADLGVASGNGKGQIFKRGEVVTTVPESKIVETLVEMALEMAEEMGVDPESGEAAGSGAVVTVS